MTTMYKLKYFLSLFSIFDIHLHFTSIIVSKELSGVIPAIEVYIYIIQNHCSQFP
jgi:hypothetical protein